MVFRSYGSRLSGENYVDIRGQMSARSDLYDRRSYGQSQVFGEQLRAEGTDGIIYDSIRRATGENVVCFVPTNVLGVVQQDHFEIQVYEDPGRKPIVIRLSA